MSEDGLLPIGHFARLTGLTVHTLRADAGQILTRHRRSVQRQVEHLHAQLSDVDRFLEKGLPMPQPVSGVRPVQIKLAVTDEDATIDFYTKAFDLEYQVTRRTKDEDIPGFVFGEYGQDSFFLVHFLNDPQDYDRPGPSTIGLLVPDLDESHRRAIQAGGVELVAPKSPEGMPRCSAVRDPSGNWVWLYQA